MLRPIRAQIAVYTLVMMSSIATSLQAMAFEQLYAFGDSLGDNGNVSLLGAGITPVPLPAPDDGFIPLAPYTRGATLLPAFSNGPIWVEQLPALLGVGPLTPSLALLARPQPPGSGGINFAFGGARSGPTPDALVPSVVEQIGSFLSLSLPVTDDDLFMLWMGGNDARDAVGAALLGADFTPFVDQFSVSLRTSALALAATGAKHLLTLSVPDVRAAPVIKSLGPAAEALAGLVVEAFTAAWRDTLDAVELELAAMGLALDVDRVDISELLGAVESDPSAFGLSNVDNGCVSDPVCVADPSGHLFWDGIHLTAVGHAMVAQASARALLPSPDTLGLVLGVGMLIALRCGRERMAQSVG